MTAKMKNGERRYGCWAGKPDGVAEDPRLCIEEVFPPGRGAMHHQCGHRRAPGHVYCPQHIPGRKASATWYVLSDWYTIAPVPVIEAGEKTLLLVDGRRVPKVTQSQRYFKDFIALRHFAISRATAEVAIAKAHLKEARGWKEPKAKVP